MKKIILTLFIFITLLLLVYKLNPKPVKLFVNKLSKSVIQSRINKDSLTIASRVNPPKGYKRVDYPLGSFQDYIRNYKLKAYDSKIINYDNSLYYWQKGHEGILDISVPKNGLQQCADALIRIRSEYLWQSDKKEFYFWTLLLMV